MRSRRSIELLLALVAILFITQAYVVVQVVLQERPAAGSFYGHIMGIFGFLLMLVTEMAYTFRKRSRNMRLGKMARWLEFHIFTGLVGPYMVLLHSSWKFNGLAGVVMLLTVIIVISGFVGRYIYTAIPRTASGTEMSMAELQSNLKNLELELGGLERGVPDSIQISNGRPDSGFAWIRFWSSWLEQMTTRNRGNTAPDIRRERTLQLNQLHRQRTLLQRQISSLASARRMLALWHAVHIPLGLTLFALAFMHIFAAIYFMKN